MLITITRTGIGPFVADPEAVEVGRELSPHAVHYRVTAPEGWSVEPAGPLRWRVRPWRIEPEQDVGVTLMDVARPEDARLIPIRVSLDLRSSFDLQRFALPLRN